MDHDVERLKHIMLPMLKYRCLHGDVRGVFRIVHNFYHSEAAVKLNFNTFSTTRRNNYKLQKFMYRYNTRKYLFCSRVVSMWNSLPNDVVEADTDNILRIILINIGLIKIFF